mgnify:CR=1 FL=1
MMSPTLRTYIHCMLYGIHNFALMRRILAVPGKAAIMTYWQKKSHVTLHLPPVNEQVIECPNHFKGIYTHFKSVILARMEIDAADSTVNGRTRMLHYIRWLRQAAIHPSLNRLSEYGVPTFECPVRTESREINSFLD